MWEMVFARDGRGAPIGKNRFDSFAKKHLEAKNWLFGRAQEIVYGLNAEMLPAQALSKGCVHSEPSGVFAIAHSGPPLRLYCFLAASRRKPDFDDGRQADPVGRHSGLRQMGGRNTEDVTWL